MFAHNTDRLARRGWTTTRRCARYILRRLMIDRATVAACREVRSLLGGATLTIHGRGWHVLREARSQDRTTGDVGRLLTDLAHASADDIVKLSGINTSTVHQSPQSPSK